MKTISHMEVAAWGLGSVLPLVMANWLRFQWPEIIGPSLALLAGLVLVTERLKRGTAFITTYLLLLAFLCALLPFSTMYQINPGRMESELQLYPIPMLNLSRGGALPIKFCLPSFVAFTAVCGTIARFFAGGRQLWIRNSIAVTRALAVVIFLILAQVLVLKGRRYSVGESILAFYILLLTYPAMYVALFYDLVQEAALKNVPAPPVIVSGGKHENG